jgi:PQQ enzyme repeat
MDRYLRALDSDTGNVLWQSRLPTQASGGTVTYSINGRQYIAISAGGGPIASLGLGLTPEADPQRQQRHVRLRAAAIGLPVRPRRNPRLHLQQRAVILLREHVQQTIRTLPHIANAVLQLAEHRLAVKLLPLLVEVDSIPAIAGYNGDILPAVYRVGDG